MPRRPLFIVLLLSMLLHAVSLGGHWAGAGNVEQAVHTLLHWAGGAHHHHRSESSQDASLLGFEAFSEELAAATLAPDESYHLDHSSDSNHHLAVDGYLSCIGPIPSSIDGPSERAGCMPPLPAAETAPRGPVLQGLRRPPRPIA
jgi:hypothetical protein